MMPRCLRARILLGNDDIVLSVVITFWSLLSALGRKIPSPRGPVGTRGKGGRSKFPEVLIPTSPRRFEHAAWGFNSTRPAGRERVLCPFGMLAEHRTARPAFVAALQDVPTLQATFQCSSLS